MGQPDGPAVLTGSITVFLGPSLPLTEARRHLPNAVFRPPAAQGDIYAAVESEPRPCAIALIDGVFQSVPAVRHKEILWALHRGVAVFGAASLGALRAAELAPLGMIGVGVIFRCCRRWPLVDDEEVALLHGPAELGWRPLTEPMVNVRATLGAACRRGLIDAADRHRLVTLAKSIFYQERTRERILALARSGWPAAGTARPDALAAWMQEHWVDVKRHDAAALLRRLRHDPGPACPADLAASFAVTEAWLDDLEEAGFDSSLLTG